MGKDYHFCNWQTRIFILVVQLLSIDILNVTFFIFDRLLLFFVECDLLRKSKSHIHVTKFFDNRNVDNYSWKGWHNNTKTCPSSFFNIIMWQLCPNASYIFLGQKCFPRLILLWQNSKKRSKVFLIHSGIPCMKNKKKPEYCRKPNLILARYYNKAQL